MVKNDISFVIHIFSHYALVDSTVRSYLVCLKVACMLNNAFGNNMLFEAQKYNICLKAEKSMAFLSKICYIYY